MPGELDVFFCTYIFIYTPFFHILVTFGYVYIYLYLLVINAKHENVIRCPVLLASDEVMKFIFPSKVSVFFHCTVLAKGFPLLHLTLTINQIDNLTITISARNAFP